MTRMPQTRTDMIALVRDAMQRQDADAPTADPEHLVMLATGRADELPAPDRARLLRAVASDPQTSQLVAELRAMDLDEPAAPPKTLGSPNWFRATRVVWAIAACLFVALSLWRLVDAPEYTTTDPIPIEAMGDEPTDPWDALAAERRAQVEAEQWRDIALISAGTVLGVVTIPLVIGLIRKRTGKPL